MKDLILFPGSSPRGGGGARLVSANFKHGDHGPLGRTVALSIVGPGKNHRVDLLALSALVALLSLAGAAAGTVWPWIPGSMLARVGLFALVPAVYLGIMEVRR